MEKVKLHAEGHTHFDRHLAIRSCETILNTYGFLEDFKMFSDLAINMVVELPASKVASLLHALNSTDFLVIDHVTGEEKLPTAILNRQDVHLYFNLSFVHHEPDFHKEVWSQP